MMFPVSNSEDKNKGVLSITVTDAKGKLLDEYHVSLSDKDTRDMKKQLRALELSHNIFNIKLQHHTHDTHIILNEFNLSVLVSYRDKMMEAFKKAKT